jgi:hypothetical protein
MAPAWSWSGASSPVTAVSDAVPSAPPRGRHPVSRARPVFGIRRDVGDHDSVCTTKEAVYGITSLPIDLAGPEQLWLVRATTLDRGNRLHWTRDVTFHEDSSELRTATAARALVAFRNLAMNTFPTCRTRQHHPRQMKPPQSRRRFAAFAI